MTTPAEREAAAHRQEYADAWRAEHDALDALPVGEVLTTADALRLHDEWTARQVRSVAPYVEPPARVLHGLLTLATGGLWGIVWIIAERKYRRRMRRANRA